MNSQSKELAKVYRSFPKAFINRLNEMIIYLPVNSYFMLNNVTNQLELDCKILEWCSRQASKGTSWQSRKYHFKGICEYFGRDFTEDEMDLIYTKLGNGINRKLCIKYIQSGFDIEVLRNGQRRI